MTLEHSFVICAYGESPFLEECIRSLKEQTIKSSIIMVTSTDNNYIRNIAKRWDIELSVNNDGGIGKDWNFGLSQTDTDLVTIAHQDDVYMKEYTKEMIYHFETDSTGLIAFSNYREIRDGKVVSANRNLRIKEKMLKPLSYLPKSKWMRRRVLSLGNAICCPSVTYNIKRIGESFRFNTWMKTNLDWLAWAELSRYDGAFIYIPKVLMCHRIHGGSETSNTIADNIRGKEDLKLLEHFWPSSIAKVIYNFYKESEKGNLEH